MKKVNIVGIGIGDADYLHNKAISAINSSDCLIGSKRTVEKFNNLNKEIHISIEADEIYEYILKSSKEKFCVLVSGDSGFFSLSKSLTEILLENSDIKLNNITAISSLQYFCSKLNMSWDNIKIVSLHGRNANFISNIMFNKRTFFITGGSMKPEYICKFLSSKGLGHLKVWVGENLSYRNERIREDKASNIATMDFDSLAVMIVENDEAIDNSLCLRSLRDDEFITGKTPMTKSEVRTVSISKLNLKRDSIVYDVGAGTGSVSIEIALRLSEGCLYAIEKNEPAVDLIHKNIEKFKAFNIEVIKGNAPEAFDNLPRPDCAFIGGSSGRLDEIIRELLKKNPYVNVVINTITLESLNEGLDCMEKYKFENVEIINMTVAKSRKLGPYNMMMGQNPIYIISGRGSGIIES